MHCEPVLCNIEVELKIERKRETKRETERDRKIKRETDRQRGGTERERKIKRETDRQRGREREKKNLSLFVIESDFCRNPFLLFQCTILGNSVLVFYIKFQNLLI